LNGELVRPHEVKWRQQDTGLMEKRSGCYGSPL